MTFDTNRFTFDHTKDYLGPVMLQGRVQVASDWNEWLAELARRTQAGTLDVLGRAVYPATTPYAFQISASNTGGNNVLMIGPGRMYVDGLLVENHGDPTQAEWDPALAEESNTPQPPRGTNAGAINYTVQPYLAPGTALPAGNGPFLVYLDAWVRAVDYLNDPDLIDKAIGLDTTGRLQTAWQVRMLDLSNNQGGTGITCDSPINNWPPAPSGGRLNTGTTPTPPSGPCCLTSGSAYTGLENQLYRVEIHKGGAVGAATFKVSRDNGADVADVTDISNVTNSAGNPASQLAVTSLGRDQVLGFAPGNWIEITDDSHEFYLPNTAGELHQIDTIDVAARTITLADKLIEFNPGTPDPKLHTRIRRWDQSGKVYESDGTTVWWDIDAQGSAEIPVPPAATTLILENGITVNFAVVANGNFLAGDFWAFAARTPDGSVEQLVDAPPMGIHHHYARLAIVSFPNAAQDCRTPWPGSGTSKSGCGCCCTVTVGNGGKYKSINDAIQALPLAGGEVCIMPGHYWEHVLIQGRQDVVLRGCGWQTILASPSLKPTATGANQPAPQPPAGPPFNAVVTVSGSQHVKLLSFAVEAADDEIGVLVDGTGTLHATTAPDPKAAQDKNATGAAVVERGVTQDVTLEDLVMTASRMPAVLADHVRLLHIERNRVAMANVRSRWPAVWVSGTEIRVLRNWLGIQSPSVNQEWLPLTVTSDLSGGAASPPQTTTTAAVVPLHPGGLQIAGGSVDVFVLENEIDRAGRNGITLGSVTILGADGTPTPGVNGVTIVDPDPCDPPITITIPGTPSGGGGKVVTSGKLVNIEICRNRIRDTGLCGIGPVGFFDLAEATEVISIENLTIAANTITSTLLGETAPAVDKSSDFGYGAICVPDVENLIIRDNAITNFGRNPGDLACGIFVLNGEMVEISRNHVLETRDWTAQQKQPSPSGVRGGIVLFLVTPPAMATANLLSPPTNTLGGQIPQAFLPNLPALRVEHNTVRVALGNALEVLGYGPFSIVNNHLATGGRVPAASRSLGETVEILNLSPSIGGRAAGAKYSDLYTGRNSYSKVGGVTAAPSCGAILFTSNTCQLEARASHQTCWASVLILGLDDLVFGNNVCWLDGPPKTATADAILFAATVQATSNRFQEAAGSVVDGSAIVFGLRSITSLNIADYALVPWNAPPNILTNNL